MEITRPARRAPMFELIAGGRATPPRAGGRPFTASADIDALLFALGENLWRSGERRRAKEMFRRAVVRAREQGAAVRLAEAALGFGGGFHGFEQGEVEPELIALLGEALQMMPHVPSTLRVRLTVRLAVALCHVADSLGRRQALCREAEHMAARTRDAAAELAALYGRHEAISGPDTLHDRIDTAAIMLRVAERAGDREAVLLARRLQVVDALELAHLPTVDASLQQCLRLGEELRRPYDDGRAATLLAMRTLVEGRLADSERWAGEALALGRRAQSRNVEQVHVWQLLAIRREQGRLGEIEPAVRRLVERFAALPVWRSAHALVLVELGRSTAARAHFELLAVRDFAGLARDAFWLATICTLADVCVELGDLARAATLYCLLEPYRGRMVALPMGAGCLGAVDRALGRLAAVLGSARVAGAHFADALCTEQQLRAPLLAARTMRDQATALLARGTSRDARAALHPLGQAEATYRTLGLPTERVVALRARAASLGGRRSRGSHLRDSWRARRSQRLAFRRSGFGKS